MKSRSMQFAAKRKGSLGKYILLPIKRINEGDEYAVSLLDAKT